MVIIEPHVGLTQPDEYPAETGRRREGAEEIEGESKQVVSRKELSKEDKVIKGMVGYFNNSGIYIDNTA